MKAVAAVRMVSTSWVVLVAAMTSTFRQDAFRLNWVVRRWLG
jgi:hypothetical protein